MFCFSYILSIYFTLFYFISFHFILFHFILFYYIILYLLHSHIFVKIINLSFIINIIRHLCTRTQKHTYTLPPLTTKTHTHSTHAWGQEQTKRRGTLACQVRGAVVKDSRGGGLQMSEYSHASLFCFVLYCIVLYCIVSYRIVSYRIAFFLFCIILSCPVLSCPVLSCFVLFCFVLFRFDPFRVISCFSLPGSLHIVYKYFLFYYSVIFFIFFYLFRSFCWPYITVVHIFVYFISVIISVSWRPGFAPELL